MADWDDVARLCLALPGTTEAVSASGRRRWLVRGRTFVRERPLHAKDLAELGPAAPQGPVAVVSVPDESAKAALLAAEPDVCFTTSHFDGWAAVLCRLDRVDGPVLAELVGEAWASRAPRRLVAEHRFPAG
ncbi:MmcQ/YjbR family DNA-binding protein [Blastococcus sp. TF02A_35]|uniref:MmcQ/YjbR family DNA-binding protein n=1 Tax=Blastococcus sp. TF02A-35 TaxID=2559612 RepID=UPI001073CBB4|nr:MmcQ/YjbR family DNA-binding protein [Blastococcus sp. TF02A_35]TFV52510.1 MmcQ/YjbR family DNA-binding protein [Blastococcus sp. TF02A_35]